MRTRSNSIFPVFASMRQAASALAIDESILQTLKDNGCTGCDASGRVRSKQVLQWALTHNRSPTDMTYEQAKTRLATARAKRIEKEAHLTDENVLDMYWAVGVVDNAFNKSHGWIDARIDNLARGIMPACGKHEVDTTWQHKSAVDQLKDDAKEIRIILRHIEEDIVTNFRLGPDGDGWDRKTFLKEQADYFDAMGKFLSPAAREEIRAFVESRAEVENDQTTSKEP